MWFSEALAALELLLAVNKFAIGAFVACLLLWTLRNLPFLGLTNRSSGRRPPWRLLDVALMHSVGLGKGPRVNYPNELGKEGSSIWRCFFLFRPAILVTGSSNVRTLLIAPHDVLQGDLPATALAILGPKSFARLHGKEHAQERRILQTAFTPTNLRGYLSRLTSVAQQTLDAWSAAGEISLYTESRLFITKVAAHVLAGFDSRWTSPEGFAKVNQFYIDIWNGFFAPPINLPGTRYRKALLAREAIEKLVQDSVADLLKGDGDFTAYIKPETQEEGEEQDASEAINTHGCVESIGNSATPQPIARTIAEIFAATKDENGKPLDTSRIATSCTAILLGAVDTTSTTLMMALYQVAFNPSIMHALRQEQSEILSKYGTAWTDESVRQMKYAEAVTKEALRLHSPAQLVFRRAMKDIEMDGYLIKKGDKVLISIAHSIASDERFIDDAPGKFRPERWLREDGGKAGAWVPFGGGLRFCLGWQLAMTEIKVFLAVLARSNLDLELINLDQERWRNFPLQTPINGLRTKVSFNAAAATADAVTTAKI